MTGGHSHTESREPWIALLPAFPEDGPADYSLAAWVGASNFAASEAFGRLSISSDEYKEHGPQLVHRRCPKECLNFKG